MSGLKSSKGVLVIALTLVAVAAWLFAIYLPSRRAEKTCKTEIASLENDLNQLRLLFQSAGQSAQLTENVRTETAEALAQLMPEDSLEQFVDQFSRALSDFGLKEIVVAPAIEEVLASQKVMVGNQRIAKVLLRTSAIGRYRQIGNAISYIEKQPFFSECRRLNLGYDADLNPAIACQLDLTIYLRAKGVGQ